MKNIDFHDLNVLYIPLGVMPGGSHYPCGDIKNLENFLVTNTEDSAARLALVLHKYGGGL